MHIDSHIHLATSSQKRERIRLDAREFRVIVLAIFQVAQNDDRISNVVEAVLAVLAGFMTLQTPTPGLVVKVKLETRSFYH